MVELAEKLLEQATVAVEDNDTELRRRLLNRAADLIETGIAKLEEGHKRGVAALWRSAAISNWLIS